MKNCLASVVRLLPIALIIVGCQSPEGPVPEDTLTGRPQTSQGGDFVDPTTVYGPGAAGLTPRDASPGANFTGAVQNEGLLPSIYFGFDQAAIDTGERAKLADAAQYLFDNPNADLLIEGHADWRGTTEYNLALADRRANAVKRYLSSLGIGAARVQTTSRGDLEATEGASEDVMARDRRADLIIVP